MKTRPKTKTINIVISRRPLVGEKGKREYASITIRDATQKEAVEFVKTTINSLGLPVIREGFVACTSIQLRTRYGNEAIGKGTNLSFYGLSPDKTKEILMKHLA